MTWDYWWLWMLGGFAAGLIMFYLFLLLFGEEE